MRLRAIRNSVIACVVVAGGVVVWNVASNSGSRMDLRCASTLAMYGAMCTLSVAPWNQIFSCSSIHRPYQNRNQGQTTFIFALPLQAVAGENVVRPRLCFYQSNRAKGAAAAVTDLKRGRDHDRARGRKLVKVGEALQAVAAGAVHEVVAGVGRTKMLRLPRVGADRLGAEAKEVALLDQELHRVGVRSRSVLAGLVVVLVGGGVGALGPVGAHQNPGFRRDASVLPFPTLDPVHSEKEVGILLRFVTAIQNRRRADEALGRDAVGGVLRQVLARDPVDRRVEVRAGVLAAGEVVPIPGGPALVVARHLLDPERPRLSHLGRQADVREFGR